MVEQDQRIPLVPEGEDSWPRPSERQSLEQYCEAAAEEVAQRGGPGSPSEGAKLVLGYS
jgi:hypothetical protein